VPALLKEILFGVLVIAVVCGSAFGSRAAGVSGAFTRSSLAHGAGIYPVSNAERFAPGKSMAETNDVSHPPDRRENLWILTSCGLIGLLALPGLALFHAGPWRVNRPSGLVGRYFIIAAVVTMLWWLFGYSAVFADGGGQIFGDCSKFAFLRSVGRGVNHEYPFRGSQALFCLFHLLVALASVAILTASLANRLKLPVLIVCVTAWMIFVYFPLARMLWGIDGSMNGLWNANASIRVIDFAGALVVQIAAGWSGVIYFLILAERDSIERPAISRSRLFAFIAGQGMIWMGWYGLSGGVWADLSAVPQSFLAMMFATLVAAFAWTVTEATIRRKPSLPGACNGALAGLMAIMPASAFVTVNGAIIIGLSAGTLPLLSRLIRRSPYERPFEIFGVHTLCGMLGLLLAGIVASGENGHIPLTNETRMNGLASLVATGGVWIEQIKALLITLAIAGSASGFVGLFIKAAEFGFSPQRLKWSNLQ